MKTEKELRDKFRKENPGADLYTMLYIRWLEQRLLATQPASEQGKGYPIYGGDGLHEGPSGSPNPIQPQPEPTDFREKVKERIAEELIGIVPIHSGPFISSAEARRLAHFDNEKRFIAAERITEAISSLLPDVTEEKLENILEEHSFMGNSYQRLSQGARYIAQCNFSDLIKAILELFRKEGR